MRKATCLLLITVLSLTICLVSCNKAEDIKFIDYSLNQEFDTRITETEDYIAYEPDTEEKAAYGLLFYPGTAIPASSYHYLGNALAHMGFMMIVPKITGSFAYMFYEGDPGDEPSEMKYTKDLSKLITDKYDFVKFYVGGHSQGGGAAVKYASENADALLGCILLSPLTYGETIKDSGLRTLILEADNDHVLTDAMKEESHRVIPDDTEYVMLANASHMSFSEMDDDSVLAMFNNDGNGMSEQDKLVQKSNTINAVCRFINTLL